MITIIKEWFFNCFVKISSIAYLQYLRRKHSGPSFFFLNIPILNITTLFQTWPGEWIHIILHLNSELLGNIFSCFRRTMEKEGRSTKFCLICNYVSRIIEPLTSRCAKFRFKPLATEILLTRLRMIVEAEKVNISQDGLDAIILTSEGDLRKAITTLQSCSRLGYTSSYTEFYFRTN